MLSKLNGHSHSPFELKLSKKLERWLQTDWFWHNLKKMHIKVYKTVYSKLLNASCLSSTHSPRVRVNIRSTLGFLSKYVKYVICSDCRSFKNTSSLSVLIWRYTSGFKHRFKVWKSCLNFCLVSNCLVKGPYWFIA